MISVPSFLRSCAFCQKTGFWICPQCLGLLAIWQGPPVSLLTYPGLRQVYSSVEYDDFSSQIIQLVKYQFYYAYAQVMAEIMWHRWKTELLHRHIDVFIPVPLHPKRQRWRGFNQANHLARALSQASGIPMDRYALVRNKFVTNQASLNQMERQSINHHFSVMGTALKGKKCCLVDDVVTTGATLSACARALEKAGAKEIIALTFAQAL